MFCRQISEKTTSTILMAWYFTTKSSGIGEVPYTHLRHTPKTALFLDLEREENLTLHERGGLVRKQDVRRKDPGRGIAPIVLTVEAPEQKRPPTRG
jgi:hypothetical protein